MDLEQRFRHELLTMFTNPHPLCGNNQATSPALVLTTIMTYLGSVVLFTTFLRQKLISDDCLITCIKFYNLVQTFFNGVVFLILFTCLTYRCIFEGFLCLPVATPYPPYSALDQWEAFGNWLFFVNKYLELLDTMWIILRQKFNQLTFLHVYHHSTVLLVFLPLARFTPTGTATWNSVLNSFVHVCMYSYYFMSASVSADKLRVIKTLLTKMQMLQFVVLILVSCSACYQIHIAQTCRNSLFYGLFMIGYGVSLLVLFANFYMNSYKSKEPRPSVEKEE